MKQIKELTREIFETTQKIEQEHPELYSFLNENPITIPAKEHVTIDSTVLSDYLDSLQEILKHYLESEKVSDQG